MSLARLYGKFTKVEEQPDGTLIVEGIASSESVDSQGEVIKASAMRAALSGYLRADGTGPVREMHQPLAAGKTIAIDVAEDGMTYITAKVIDPVAITKVREGVYQGFSIGGSVPPGGRSKDNPKVIEAIKLVEISLVDRPANPDAVFQVVKVDEAVEEPAKPVAKAVEPPAPAPEPVKPPEPVIVTAETLQKLLSDAIAALPKPAAPVVDVAAIEKRAADAEAELAKALEATAAAGEALKKVMAERDEWRVKAELKGVLKVVPVSKAEDNGGKSAPVDLDKLDPVALTKVIHASGGRRIG